MHVTWDFIFCTERCKKIKKNLLRQANKGDFTWPGGGTIKEAWHIQLN